MYLAQQQERNYKSTPHAKQEELLFTVYVGDRQWVDSVSMTWLCWWCVLCVFAGGRGVGDQEGGALKMCILLVPVCIPKTGEWNQTSDWLIFWGCGYACLRACTCFNM